MNQILEIVNQTGKPAYRVAEDDLDGIVSKSTFYSLIDERGIPPKTQWETIEKVLNALGYSIRFEKDGK